MTPRALLLLHVHLHLHSFFRPCDDDVIVMNLTRIVFYSQYQEYW